MSSNIYGYSGYYPGTSAYGTSPQPLDGLVFVYAVLSIIPGIVVGYSIWWLLPCYRAQGLLKEYKGEGEAIVGCVTGAVQRVQLSVNRGSLGGYSVGERTLERKLHVEYQVEHEGKTHVIRKKFRFVTKKVFERPSETGDVELLYLKSRGPFSAFPRDAFYPTKCQIASQIAMFTTMLLIFVILAILGVVAYGGPFMYVYLPFFVVEFFVGLLLCEWTVRFMLRGGKDVRIATADANGGKQAMESPIKWSCTAPVEPSSVIIDNKV